jgi:2-desacetyl-2-hydroxyethyl bacteriochlorophyllide A dehydrogenase
MLKSSSQSSLSDNFLAILTASSFFPKLAAMGDGVRSGVLRQGKVEVERLEQLKLQPTDVRIAVAFVGICGSELHSINEPEARDFDVDRPVVLGHEYTGVVTEVGAAVRNLTAGIRVTCFPRIPCLRCHACRMGDVIHCGSFIRAERGAWADEIVVDERFVVPLSPGASLRDMALSEPLAGAIRGIDLAAAFTGHDAAVFGAGPIGYLTAVLAARTGARRVFVSEPSEYRRQLVSSLENIIVIDPTDVDPVDAILEATNGRGVDVAYEAVGRAEVVETSIQVLAPGGRMVVLGVAAPSAVAAIRPRDLFNRELSISAAWGLETTFLRAVLWIPDLHLTPLITHEFELDRIAEAVALASSAECGKVMLSINPDIA